MPRVPAICQNCKTLHLSGLNIEGRDNTLINCSSSCPRCGTESIILDGVYSAIDGALQALVGEQSIELLKQLRDTLEQAKQQALEPEEVRHRIGEASPELKKFGDCLPKTRSELYVFILVLIGLLNLLIETGKSVFSKQEVSNYYDITINNVCEVSENSVTTDSLQEMEDVVDRKPGRNDPCSCGSGKKFKKCCGKNRS